MQPWLQSQNSPWQPLIYMNSLDTKWQHPEIIRLLTERASENTWDFSSCQQSEIRRETRNNKKYGRALLAFKASRKDMNNWQNLSFWPRWNSEPEITIALERNIPWRMDMIEKDSLTLLKEAIFNNNTSLTDTPVRKLLQVHREDVSEGH